MLHVYGNIMRHIYTLFGYTFGYTTNLDTLCNRQGVDKGVFYSFTVLNFSLYSHYLFVYM